jgi:hypothetical protein
MPKTGFGSYLFDILPKQQAVAAGAFSFTMRQVKNIERVDIKKFSRAVANPLIKNLSKIYKKKKH